MKDDFVIRGFYLETPCWLPAIALLLLFTISSSSAHADQIKANNSSNLETGGSWVSGIAPAGTDFAIWNNTVATPANCTNTLGAAVTWSGIVISNPAAPVFIGGGTTLTLSNGINLANANVNLTVDCGTITLGTNQTWNVASGRTLTIGVTGHSGSINGGNFTITKTGSGVLTSSGNSDNGSAGITVNQGTLNLNKTSSSGSHVIGGPGMTINNGATDRKSTRLNSSHRCISYA